MIQLQERKDGPIIEIVSLKDGHLRCKEHGLYWCDHIKEVLLLGNDHVELWTTIAESFDQLHMDHCPVMIPYSPEMECWVQVEIKEEASSGRTAYVISPETTNTYRIGVIFPGEGRLVIRSMVHNWFIGQTFQPGAKAIDKCSATSHKYQQQVALSQNLKDPSKAPGEQWLMFFTGMCHACNVLKEQATNFVPSY